MYFNEEHIRYLSLGAQILGGGGGGQEGRGLKTAADALRSGRVELIDPDQLAPSDLVVTVSGVGAPSKKEAMYTSQHYLRALELLEGQLDRPIAGFIPSEMGGSAAFGPFLAAAAKGVPVINAACDGRAHPLGTMGALGLNRDPNYETIQAACGGKRENGTYIEVLTRGTIHSASKASRMAADLAGGLATVVRNPVTAEYLKDHAAVGCYTMAMEVGKAVAAAAGPMEKAQAAADALGGRIVCRGTVTEYELISKGGLDHGRCKVATDDGAYELHFYNEYMALERDGERLGTFPDLISTLDAQTGSNILTADMALGRQVILLLAPYGRLILASGLRQTAEYEKIEQVLGIPMVPFVQELLSDSE